MLSGAEMIHLDFNFFFGGGGVGGGGVITSALHVNSLVLKLDMAMSILHHV